MQVRKNEALLLESDEPTRRRQASMRLVATDVLSSIPSKTMLPDTICGSCRSLETINPFRWCGASPTNTVGRSHQTAAGSLTRLTSLELSRFTYGRYRTKGWPPAGHRSSPDNGGKVAKMERGGIVLLGPRKVYGFGGGEDRRRFAAGTPRRLFPTGIHTPDARFDVTADNQRFLNTNRIQWRRTPPPRFF